MDKHYEAIHGFMDRGVWARSPQVEKTNYPFSGFIRRDPTFVDKGYLLLPRYSAEDKQDIIELIRLQDYKVLHKWIPSIEELRRRTNVIIIEGENILSHPILLKNGEIVFHMSRGFSWGGALVKIDRKGGVVWAIDGYFHHSIELDHEGNILVCFNNKPSLVDFPVKEYWDNGYAVVSQDGKLLKTYSVAKMMIDNGYKAMFVGSGAFEADRAHINDVQPIYKDIGSAKKGDVAISLRNFSTILLFRPSTEKIVWIKTGPWVNQHDVNLLEDGGFSVFGNDYYRIGEHPSLRMNEISEVYFYYPDASEVKTPYTNIFKKARMSSAVGGRSTVLDNGDVFVEAYTQRRLLRVSAGKVRWEYVNKIGKNLAGAIHWSRYLSSEEFADDAEGAWLSR
jgi:hypothetical protein